MNAKWKDSAANVSRKWILCIYASKSFAFRWLGWKLRESEFSYNFLTFTAQKKTRLHSRKLSRKCFLSMNMFEHCSGEQATMLESHHGGLGLLCLPKASMAMAAMPMKLPCLSGWGKHGEMPPSARGLQTRKRVLVYFVWPRVRAILGYSIPLYTISLPLSNLLQRTLLSTCSLCKKFMLSWRREKIGNIVGDLLERTFQRHLFILLS